MEPYDSLSATSQKYLVRGDAFFHLSPTAQTIPETQEMRSQLVEHKLAYKGQLQCIKKFDGSNDYGSIFDVH